MRRTRFRPSSWSWPEAGATCGVKSRLQAGCTACPCGWLRARKGQIRRRVEQQSDDDLDAVEAPVLDGAARWNESAEIVHQEVGRLAEKYRGPIVLCYLEGLTHDQAAARLKWPVGTVRSRLSRGRDRLRGRLVRRGVTAPAVLGPLAAWLGAQAGTTAQAAALTPSILPAVPASLVASTVRSASLFASGKTATVAVFPPHLWL